MSVYKGKLSQITPWPQAKSCLALYPCPISVCDKMGPFWSLVVFENPTTPFICDDLIFWAFCPYTRPLHSRRHLFGACGGFSISHVLCSRCREWDDYSEPLRCSAAQYKLWGFGFLSSKTWNFCVPKAFPFLLSLYMAFPIFQLPSNLELLSWDFLIRKPGRKWRNGGGHQSSLHLAGGLPFGNNFSKL